MILVNICRLLEAKKMKQQKVQEEEDLAFHGCEEIKFGDIVEASPKLTAYTLCSYRDGIIWTFLASKYF